MTYESPELVEYGTVQNLTKYFGTENAADVLFGKNNNVVDEDTGSTNGCPIPTGSIGTC